MTSNGLTDDDREALGLIVNRYDNDDQSLNDWHPCRECRTNGPCPCSGRPWLGEEMTAAIERVMAASHSRIVELEAKLAAARSALAAVRDVRQAQIERDGR